MTTIEWDDDKRAVESRLRLSGLKAFTRQQVANLFREIDDYDDMLSMTAAQLFISELSSTGTIRLLDHGTPQEWTWT